MACGSGLKSIDLAYRAVRDGDADVVLAGGTESMSRVPYLLTGARWGYRLGDQMAVDGMYQDGFLCPLAEQVMGETAETLAAQYRIPREEQDGFALRSQQRAARAWDEGRFRAEVVPLTVPARGGEVEISRDEHPRPDATAASLARLKPAFGEGPDATMTAGNSTPLSDGASAVLLGSDEWAAAHRLPLSLEMSTFEPWGSLLVRLSFQARSRPVASRDAPVGAALPKSPMMATPVEPALNPRVWAPSTGRSIPPARPSQMPP